MHITEEYKVKASGTKRYSLTISDKEIGLLEYENHFSFKARITINDSLIYYVKPKGLWGTTIELMLEDSVVLTYNMNWKGHIIIKTMLSGIETQYSLKHKGFLKSSFVLSDIDQQELFVIQPDLKWNKMNYEYAVSTTSDFDQMDLKEVLLLMAVHGAKYYTSMMTSVVA